MRWAGSHLYWFSAAALISCAGDDPERSAPEPVADSDLPTREEVLESCEAFAEAYCDNMEECCEGVHGAHDAEACRESFVDGVCRPGADAAAAGRADFDPDAVTPCLDAYARAFDTCQADWDEILALRADIYRACRVIDGHVEPDGGCQTSVLCRKPKGAGTAACVGGTCRTIEVLSEGDSCDFPSGDVSVCDSGLYCTSPGLEQTGVCAPVTPTDEACDVNSATNECGLGNYCDRASETCQPAANFGGPSCEQHGECVSFNCDQTVGECAPAAVVALGTCVGR